MKRTVGDTRQKSHNGESSPTAGLTRRVTTWIPLACVDCKGRASYYSLLCRTLRAVLPGGFFTRIHSMKVVAADNAYLRNTPLAYNVLYQAVVEVIQRCT